MKKFAIAALMLSACMPALAEDEYYLNVQYSFVDVSVDGDGVEGDPEPEALGFVIGKHINKHFAIEGGLMAGVDKDEYGDAADDFEFRSALVISGVAKLPLADGLDLHAKLGLVHAQYQDESENEADIEGLVYGVGVSALVTDSIGFTIDYSTYADGEYDDTDIDIETDVVAFGTKFVF